MSEARLADALARLEDNKTLRLPLRSRDLFGRLALRFLWRRHLKWQVEVNEAVKDAVAALRDMAGAQRRDLAGLIERAGNGSDFATREQLRVELEVLRRSDQNMMAGLNQRLYSAVGALRTELGDLRLRLADKTEDAGGVDDRLAAVEERITGLVAAARDARFRHARLDLFLDDARAARTSGTVGSTDDVPSTDVPARPAHLELAVAELLDGPVEGVRTARAAYLPVVRDAREAGATGPVFDVAPGRGEWLEVLRAAEVPARSASANPLVVRHCAELGQVLAEADALDALAGAGVRSLGAVTAFRLVERLTPDALARFVDLAARALQPGGVLVVETPNAAGAATGDFHLDPFARQPVHPVYLRFLAEAAGFAKVELRYPDTGPFGGWPADLGAAPDRRADRYCLLAWM
jgi:SAM-dependent methyltransferase